MRNDSEMKAAMPAMRQTAPAPCDLKVGDKVAYTNSYGVVFENRVVIGFRDTDGVEEDFRPGSFVHIDSDCWWCPVKPGSLTLTV